MNESKCPHCSRKVESSWKSCPFCGKSLEVTLFSKIKGLFGEKEMAAEPVTSAPLPPRFPGHFRLEIEDVFSISGRGLVVVGVVQGDSVAVGDRLAFTSVQGAAKFTTVKAIEMFRKKLDRAEPGENVGLLLSDVEKTEVARGTVLSGAGP